MKTAGKIVSLISASACLLTFSACSSSEPTEYTESVNFSDLVTVADETTTEARNYKEGWPKIVLSYVSAYFGEGDYVKTVSKNESDGTIYVMAFDDVPLEDAISYGRSVGIWEDDWTKELDGSSTVIDKHKKFVISLTYSPESFSGYNFKISVKILN